MSWHHRATFTGHRGSVYTLIPGDRPGSFLSGAGDGHVVRWDPERPDQGELLATVDRPVFALWHDHQRNMLFIGKDDGGAHVLDLRTKQERHLFQVHRKGIFSIMAMPGERIACAGGDGTISIWNCAPVELVRQIPVSGEKVRALALSRDQRWLAAGDGEGILRVLDTADLNEHGSVRAHEGGCTAVAFHPSKPVVVSGGKDGWLRAFDADDLRQIHAFPAHAAGIYAIAFSPDGSLCTTASRDKTVKLWDAATFDPIQRLDREADGHSHSVNALLWLGVVLISAGDDRKIISWERKG